MSKAKALLEQIVIATEDDPNVLRGMDLMTALSDSGLLNGYSYHEIITAFLALGTKATFIATKLPPVECLRIIDRELQVILAGEEKHGLMAALWGPEPN